MGILFVLIGAFCFAISNAYWKKVTQTIPYQIGMFYRGIFASGVFAILYFGFRHATFFKYWVIEDLTFNTHFLLSIALSIFNIFGLLFFFTGHSKSTCKYCGACICVKSIYYSNSRFCSR